MIKANFLNPEDRHELELSARDGSSPHRYGRRANAILLLDKGMSCSQVASVLFLDDDTVRQWYRYWVEDGFDGLMSFGFSGSDGYLSREQSDILYDWVCRTLPRSIRGVGGFIRCEFGIDYKSRSGLINLLHRIGLEYRKPEVIGRQLDVQAQEAFIAAYDGLMNSLDARDVVIFSDAVHPTFASKIVGCWASKGEKLACEQTSGRKRVNLHGGIDLETGKTFIHEAETVDALSTIALFEKVETAYPHSRQIHLFVDNAAYHHAKIVRQWLEEPNRRIKLHFIPVSCPHLNPIERLWGVMHKNITHNRCYGSLREFAQAILTFLRNTVPKNWHKFCDQITDNFRVINPDDFRVLK